MKKVEDGHTTIQNCRVVGVCELDKYKSCLRCKARVEPSPDGLGKWSKADCRILQSVDLYRSLVCQASVDGKLQIGITLSLRQASAKLGSWCPKVIKLVKKSLSLCPY